MELRDRPPPHKKVELCESPALHPCVLRCNPQRNFVTDLRNFVGGIPRTPQQCWAPAGVAPETPPTTLLWGAGVCLRSSISHGGVQHPGILTGACFVRVSGRRGCQAMFLARAAQVRGACFVRLSARHGRQVMCAGACSAGTLTACSALRGGRLRRSGGVLAGTEAPGAWACGREARECVCWPVLRRSGGVLAATEAPGAWACGREARECVFFFFGPRGARALRACGAWRGGRIRRQGWTLGGHTGTWCVLDQGLPCGI